MIHKFFILRDRLSSLKASSVEKPGSLFLERFAPLFVFETYGVRCFSVCERFGLHTT